MSCVDVCLAKNSCADAIEAWLSLGAKLRKIMILSDFNTSNVLVIVMANVPNSNNMPMKGKMMMIWNINDDMKV